MFPKSARGDTAVDIKHLKKTNCWQDKWTPSPDDAYTNFPFIFHSFFKAHNLIFLLAQAQAGPADADWLKKLVNCCLQVAAFFIVIQPTSPFLLAC